MKYLIFGKGYIANKFKDFLGSEAEISDLRVESLSSVKEEIESKKPEVVINCAGKTGRPNVDWCEDHKAETLFGNVTVPLILSKACEDLNTYFVHIGSGCVYDGYNEGNGYSEVDEPNFEGSFYSRTKAWSEKMLSEFPVLQLRLRMPFDSIPGERNFITKILKYPKVISTENSISVLDDFLMAGKALMDRKEIGIFNMTNPGTINHQEILEIYKEEVDPNLHYELFSVEEMEKITKAKRSNCGLSSRKLESLGIKMRPVKEAIRDALKKYKVNLEQGITA